jgi:hypothetical protein
MAGVAGRGPTDRAWRAAVALGVLLIAGAFAYALLYPLVLGHGCPCHDRYGRLVLVVASSRDLWITVDAARYVANGALGFVYESSIYLTALPLFPILLAPLVAVGQALGLSEPPAPTSTMYLLLAPFMVGIAIPLLHQVRGVVRDTVGGESELAVQAWTALLVGVPVLAICGHGEDALALLALLAAVRLAGRDRWVAAGFLLGVAIASKQWAVLALPALLVRSHRTERPRLAAAAVALPAALALFVLAVDWSHASRALLFAPNYPGYGHAGLWVDTSMATVMTAPFRVGVLALAVALAGRCGRGTSQARLLAVLGLTLLARCTLEPVVHVYYLAPGLCLLLLHERVTTGRCARTGVVGGLLVAWFPVHLAPALWWSVTAVLGVAVAYRAGREVLFGTAETAAGAVPGMAASRSTGPSTPAGRSRRGAWGRAIAARDSSATGSHQ